MNPETLENLLIDRALGQLSPEVEILLDEYLAASPGAAQSAAELREVVTLAAAALRKPRPSIELPPRVVATPFWPKARRALALAASFAVGASAAFVAMRSAAPTPAPQIVRVEQAAPPLPSKPARSPEVEQALRKLPFWSKERAYLLAASARAETR